MIDHIKRTNQERLLAPLSRRVFLRYSAALGALAGFGVLPRPLRALLPAVRRPGEERPPDVSYDLAIDRLGVNFTGSSRNAVAINGTIPGPLLRLREGEDVELNVTNHLDEDTSIHWHGLLVPAGMDGVPGLSFEGIRPGETFRYRFRVRQSGTYWYHSHSGLQEQQGHYAPMIIEPAGAEPHPFDREHVIVLSDWTDEDPMEVLRNLKGDGGYYNFGKRTIPQFFRDLFRSPGAVIRDRDMWGRMRMDPTDIADVTGATYTYLMNGRTPNGNWTALFRPGEKVRLRFINASAMTYFDVKIPGLRMKVVQADGQDVEAVEVDELQIAVAETYDVIVEPHAGMAHTIFAQAMDRSGYARGTLAEREGATAAIPPMDPRPLRTMADMGMAGHAGHGAMAEAPPAMEHAGHEGHAMPTAQKKLEYSDLRALVPNRDVREPEREVVVRLTGDMERYFWTLNDQKVSEADPIRLKLGERVRLKLVNETMMEHPMHLHGVFVELQNGQAAAHAPRKHTISVPPFQTVEAHLTFDEAGPWAFHCHLLLHMATGMFVPVIVEDDRALSGRSGSGGR